MKYYKHSNPTQNREYGECHDMVAIKIERKTPKAGVIFERTFAGKKYKLKVINTPKGLAYELDDQVYETPTSAAKNITKFEVNGWRFWYMKRK